MYDLGIGRRTKELTQYEILQGRKVRRYIMFAAPNESVLI